MWLVRNLRFALLVSASQPIKSSPGGALPGCRAKEKTGQRVMLSVKNQVFHVLSHGAAETEVMIPGEQALEEPQRVCIPSAPLRTSLNGIDLNWNKGPQVSGNSSGLMGNIGNKDRAFTLAGKRVVWGRVIYPRCSNFSSKLRQAISLIWPLALRQSHNRHSSLESRVRFQACPDVGQGWIGFDHLPNPSNIRRRYFPSLNEH